MTVYWTVEPGASWTPEGVTAIEDSDATVSTVVPRTVLPPRPRDELPDDTDAVMVAVPPATPVARPVLVMVATRVLLEVQVAEEVTSALVPLL